MNGKWRIFVWCIGLGLQIRPSSYGRFTRRKSAKFSVWTYQMEDERAQPCALVPVWRLGSIIALLFLRLYSFCFTCRNFTRIWSTVQIPTLVDMDPIVTASERRCYKNAHSYHVNSISVCSDGQHFISADDLRVNLWNLSRQQSFSELHIESDMMHIINIYSPFFTQTSWISNQLIWTI